MGSYRTIRRGFSLPELLIVISIISILASVALVNFQDIRIAGRDTQRKTDLSQIHLALRMYKDVHGIYPSFRGGTFIGEGSAIDTILLSYFSSIPHDPLSGLQDGFRYYYDSEIKCYGSEGTTYTMLFALKTEKPETANWSSLCPMPPGGAAGNDTGKGVGAGYGNDKVDTSAYAVILN